MGKKTQNYFWSKFFYLSCSDTTDNSSPETHILSEHVHMPQDLNARILFKSLQARLYCSVGEMVNHAILFQHSRVTTPC